MTILAGVDIHQTVLGAVMGVLPPMTVKQNGKEFTGYGVVDGDTATFVPTDRLFPPKRGSALTYQGRTRAISEIAGTEDTWEFTLSEDEVQDLSPIDEFDFDLEATGSGFVVLTRIDAGNADIRGRWRLDKGNWNGFSTTKGTTTFESGAGRVEVAARRINEDGTSTDLINKTIDVT